MISWRALCAVLGALVIGVAASCGDDGGDSGGGATDITVAIADGALTVPGEVSAGVVSVTLTGGEPETEVEFSRVVDGTTEEEFREAIGVVLEGGPIADFIEANSGAMAGTEPGAIQLEPGQHFVWVEGDSDILLAPTEVTGDAGGELPPTDGTITARDYGFEVDVGAGTRFTFSNSGPDQLHHAVVANFGDLDPDAVREALPELLASEEGGSVPDVFADFDVDGAFQAGSGVFSPGLGGTFETTIEPGNTYALFCFIGDRAGGPPHAIAYDMFEVFQVS